MKNKLNEMTVKSILRVKINLEMNCSEMYKMPSNKEVLLEQIGCIKKYSCCTTWRVNKLLTLQILFRFLVVLSFEVRLMTTLSILVVVKMWYVYNMWYASFSR